MAFLESFYKISQGWYACYKNERGNAKYYRRCIVSSGVVAQVVRFLGFAQGGEDIYEKIG